jgi:hypothetical protein
MSDQLLQDLIEARHKLAQLVLMDRVYAPVYQRVEHEIAALEAERDLIARARAVVQLHKAAG